MNMSATKEETECFSKEPLVESLAWPLPVIKTETKEEVPEVIAQVWIKKEYELPETLNEEDPLTVNTDQVNERVVKTEVKEEEHWENQQYTLPMEQGVEDVKDALALKTEEVIIDDVIIDDMEEDSSNASDSTNNSLVFPCEKCAFTYVSPLYLENHKKYCRGPKKPVVRVQPEEVTTDVQTLAKVVNGKKLYFCELCNYQTRKIWFMRDHLVAHSGKKPYQCEACDKKFTQKASLTQHKRIHTNDKPYKCSECSYACNQIDSLKKHMPVHTGEKVLACKLCTFRTGNRSNLTDHIRTHTKKKPFSCTQCEYKATISSSLKKHIRAIHTGEKPFSCAQCEYRATQICTLKSHILRRHTDYRPFSCAHCEYKTVTKYELSQHLKNKKH